VPFFGVLTDEFGSRARASSCTFGRDIAGAVGVQIAQEDTDMSESSRETGDFRLERQMALPTAQWMRRRGLTTKSEFSLPWGVCDLVGVKLDRSKMKRRLASGQKRAVGSFLRVMILSKIPDLDTGRSISISGLARQFKGEISTEVLAKELQRLSRDKFVRIPRRGFFQNVNGWAPLHREIVAVELKLARVSEAVNQAVSNREFATHSYVALPMSCALDFARSVRAEVLARNGIGLLGVSSVICREIIKPRMIKSAANPIVQTHVVERFWRTRGN
jgi:hypothetical protein